VPATFRLILVLIVLGGLAYAASYFIGNFYKPEPREIVTPVPDDRFAN